VVAGGSRAGGSSDAIPVEGTNEVKARRPPIHHRVLKSLMAASSSAIDPWTLPDRVNHAQREPNTRTTHFAGIPTLLDRPCTARTVFEAERADARLSTLIYWS
jgi:hypothetical protein